MTDQKGNAEAASVARKPIKKMEPLPRKGPIKDLVKHLLEEMTRQGKYDGYTFSKIEPKAIFLFRVIVDNMVTKWTEAARLFVLTEARGRKRTDRKTGIQVPAIRKTLYEGDFDLVIRTWGRSVAEPQVLNQFARSIVQEKKDIAAKRALEAKEKRDGGEGEHGFQAHYGISSQIIEQLVKRGAPDVTRLSGPKSWLNGINQKRAIQQRKEVMGVYNRIRTGIAFLIAIILRRTVENIVESRPNKTHSYNIRYDDVSHAVIQLKAANLT